MAIFSWWFFSRLTGQSLPLLAGQQTDDQPHGSDDHQQGQKHHRYRIGSQRRLNRPLNPVQLEWLEALGLKLAIFTAQPRAG
jgi:hypothetical protein